LRQSSSTRQVIPSTSLQAAQATTVLPALCVLTWLAHLPGINRRVPSPTSPTFLLRSSAPSVQRWLLPLDAACRFRRPRRLQPQPSSTPASVTYRETLVLAPDLRTSISPDRRTPRSLRGLPSRCVRTPLTSSTTPTSVSHRVTHSRRRSVRYPQPASRRVTADLRGSSNLAESLSSEKERTKAPR